MPAERFDFPNPRGEQLAALLDRPDGPVRAVRAVRALLHLRQRHPRGQAHRRAADLPASACCASISPGWAAAKANSPIRISPPTSTIWSPPPISCARRARPRNPDRPQPGGAAVLAAAQDRRSARRGDDRRAVRPAHVVGLFGDELDGHPRARRGRGHAGRAAVPHQARIPRRRRRAEWMRHRQSTQGAADLPLADR